MSDLVSGRYPQFSPFQAAFGNLSNETQANVPARSNAEILGFSTSTDGVLGTSGVATAVAVPVDPGTVITRLSIIVGATAASTPTHSFVALYSGIATPALLGQSTDKTTTAIAASALFGWALTTPYLVKQADVANGYLYAVVVVAGTTVPTAMCMATPTAVGYQAFTASTTPAAVQPMLSATSGSGLTATAAATLTLAAKAVAPIVILT